MNNMNIRMICAISLTAGFNIFNGNQCLKSGGSKPGANASWPCKTIYMGKFTVGGHNMQEEPFIG